MRTPRVALALLIGIGWARVISNGAPAAPPSAADDRLKTASEAFPLAAQTYRNGSDGFSAEVVCRWSLRWREAQANLATTKEGRIAALEADVARLSALEQVADAKLKAGIGSPLDVYTAHYWLLEAQTALSELGAK